MITTIEDLKDRLKQDFDAKVTLLDCEIDVLLIYPISLKSNKAKIISATVVKQKKKKVITAKFDANFTIDFVLDGKSNLLINTRRTICLFDKDSIKKIKEMLTNYKDEHIKKCLEELKETNKDYTNIMKEIILYDSNNKQS
jgi:hypothetical protein